MRRIHTSSRYLVLILCLLSVVGCMQQEWTDLSFEKEEYIGFRAALSADTRSESGSARSASLSMDEEAWALAPSTRSSLVTSLKGLEVGMYAHAIKGSTVQSSVMSNRQYRFVDNEQLETVGDYVLWSTVGDADVLRAYGYAPYNASIEATTTNGKTTINYTAPADVANQQDLIATSIEEVPSTYEQNIPLTFEHILTGVRFKVGFACTVTSLEITGVRNAGKFTIGEVWTNQSGSATFSLPISGGGRVCAEGDYVTWDGEILMMIPQQIPSTANVVMTYTDSEGTGTIAASLAGLTWNQGALVTYTLHKASDNPFVYFDLMAGDVSITPLSYSGSVYVNGEARQISKTWKSSQMDDNQYHYYVYQSTLANKASTGYKDEAALSSGLCRIPKYDPVKVGDQAWSDFITNNSNVEAVIEAWDTKENIDDDGDSLEVSPSADGAVRKVGRSSTNYYIEVDGNTSDVFNVQLTLDNVYSRKQVTTGHTTRTIGGLVFTPQRDGSTLTVNLIGDSRFGCVHYYSGKDDSNFMNNKIVFQGMGSLTVATTNFYKEVCAESKDQTNYFGDNVKGYYTNRWCSAIGGNDGAQGHAIGIVFKSGTIYAGTTQTENCTAIGGGGNDQGHVRIEGGSVTAVATTTGTAIGGGIGFHSQGGKGNVSITGGSVFAYNHANEWEIPSAAIGSAGSMESNGGEGTVTISGGYVYAQTALGTAIGGGSSKTKSGGSATINISGNSYVIAKSISAIDKWQGKNEVYPAGNGIGGGTGGSNAGSNGGSATVNISGNPTIRTGSIGGGKTNNSTGNIGHAVINISGGDISAQFVMAGGAGKSSSFIMDGGTISNSDVHSKEFYHVQQNGGAVYMEDGSFIMRAGTIRNCSSVTGGAVFIQKSAKAKDNPTFEMKGGTITNCQSETHGGAVYLEGGSVTMTGGEISGCLARNGNGGGLYIAKGNLTMSGSTAQVLSNSALNRSAVGAARQAATTLGSGGGIYVTSPSGDVTVNILGGNILYNACDQNGGGICVDMEGSSGVARIDIGVDKDNGPQIDYNKAVLYGGGLYAIGAKAQVTINGGSIQGNGVTNYVPNEDVANEGGTVVLNDGEVSHVVVTFDLNTQDPTASVNPGFQKIVTATNSFLVAPTPNRSLYVFKGWNTRKDGLGTFYTTGDPMFLTSDLRLYAQWQSQ